MEKIDKELLNHLQNDFPISSRPFLEIGRLLGISEEEALERTNRLKKKGYIRRIGGVFHSPALGFTSTLTAARVDPQKLEHIAKHINAYRGVTHNYERNNSRYNLWFTLTGASEVEIDALLEQVKAMEGVEQVMKLPALRLFKLKFNLTLK